jgi:methanethiol S-methyltransferase
MIYDIINVIGIVIFFYLFGVLHSYLASEETKKKFAAKYGEIIVFYRLAYNLIFLFALIIFWSIWPRTDLLIYQLYYPYDLLMLGLQFFCLLGLIYTFRFIKILEFLGFSQIYRYFKGSYQVDELDERISLRIAGPYRFVRHPVYFFTIGILLFRAEMDLFYFIFLLCIIAYFYIGTHYEEARLLKYFGERYKKYQENVPRLFPSKIHKPYIPEKVFETK